MKQSVCFIAILALLASCCPDSDGVVTDITDIPLCNLTINAKASDSNCIEYPVSIDVYDEKGSSVEQKTISSASDAMSISLLTGTYTVFAISGDRDFNNGYTTSYPFMMGSKNINLTSDLTESIVMDYKVASVKVVLSDIATNVTDVSITVGPQYAAISPKGELSGETIPTIKCSRTDDGQWISGTFYVLPGTSDNTIITINQTSPKETKVFTITYTSPLEAGKPYIFNGAYNGSYAKYALSITISANGWDDDIVNNFGFNDKDNVTIILGGTSDETPNTPSTGDKLTEGTIWNGHIVALVDGNTATLLSTKEWILSDVNILPKEEMSEYSEGDIIEWNLPTEEQGIQLAKKYSVASNKFADLNKILTEKGLQNLHDGKKATDDVRYLCEDGTRAYSYIQQNAVYTNDSKRLYRIRLVKTITIE